MTISVSESCPELSFAFFPQVNDGLLGRARSLKEGVYLYFIAIA